MTKGSLPPGRIPLPNPAGIFGRNAAFGAVPAGQFVRSSLATTISLHRQIRSFVSRSILVKYSLLFALAAGAILAVVLVSASALTQRQDDRAREALQAAFSHAQSQSEEKELQRSANYLSVRLREPLERRDAAALDAEIRQLGTLLSVESYLILDQEGRVIADGTRRIRQRFDRDTLPPALRPGYPVILAKPAGFELYFTIGHPNRLAGYGKLVLAGSPWIEATRALHSTTTRLWKGQVTDLIGVWTSGMGVSLGLITLLFFRFTQNLAHRFRELQQVADRISAGDRNLALTVRSSDEAGMLARSLNQLAVEFRKSRKLLGHTQEIAGLGSWEWDVRRRRLATSPQVMRILGWKEAETSLPFRTLIARIDPGDRRRVIELFRRDCGKKPFSRDLKCRRPDGTVRLVRLRGQPLWDAERHVTSWIGTLQDTTEIRAAEEKLSYLTNHDTLTGLPNRYRFQERLQQAMRHAERNHSRAALLFLDLDRFKGINDALGHAVGDELLKLVAKRLKGAVRECDTVARLGGDEFTILVENAVDEQMIGGIAERVGEAIAQSFSLADERDLSISCSIGITIFPNDGKSVHSLLKNADAAMYRAKAQGRGLYRFYTAEMNHRAQDRLMLENRLRNAVREGEFELHFQPQIAFSTGRLLGTEALLRWRTPAGLVPPNTFIPILEDTGMIEDVSAWVLETACRQTRRWHDLGLTGLRVAVNLSARQFQQANLSNLVAQILVRTGLPADCLELEITESTLLDADSSRSAVDCLERLGIRMAIDDFGTGYSSLAYLKRLSVDALKIDRSFIQEIPDDQDDSAISLAIINLSKNLGLEVIAEGVETPEQWNFLREHGCELMQGYIASRPVPGDEFWSWVQDHCQQAGGGYFWRNTPSPDAAPCDPYAESACRAALG